MYICVIATGVDISIEVLLCYCISNEYINMICNGTSKYFVLVAYVFLNLCNLYINNINTGILINS